MKFFILQYGWPSQGVGVNLKYFCHHITVHDENIWSNTMVDRTPEHNYFVPGVFLLGDSAVYFFCKLLLAFKKHGNQLTHHQSGLWTRHYMLQLLWRVNTPMAYGRVGFCGYMKFFLGSGTTVLWIDFLNAITFSHNKLLLLAGWMWKI